MSRRYELLALFLTSSEYLLNKLKIYWGQTRPVPYDFPNNSAFCYNLVATKMLSEGAYCETIFLVFTFNDGGMDYGRIVQPSHRGRSVTDSRASRQQRRGAGSRTTSRP
jgi:hypothetical protein